MTEAVVLQGGPAPAAQATSRRARALVRDGAPPSVDDALALAAEIGHDTPRPGEGSTLALWEVLATLGAADLTLARVLEPHLDALTILHEAWRVGAAPAQFWPDHATWGVYAAEGPGGRLRATQDRLGQWRLDGPKSWCSLAGHVSHALVTAWVGEDRRLFAVALRQPGVDVQPADGWVSRGLAQVTSTGLHFADVPAEPVGETGWYLHRPGFAWGGAGVAAIWFGASVALGRRLVTATQARPPDQVALMHLGAVDVALSRARAVLVDAAGLADSEAGAAGADLACQRVRQVLADTAHEVLERVGSALGPGPLTGEEEHARRVADLTVYVRQHHGDRDRARLGSSISTSVDAEGPWSWW